MCTKTSPAFRPSCSQRLAACSFPTSARRRTPRATAWPSSRRGTPSPFWVAASRSIPSRRFAWMHLDVALTLVLLVMVALLVVAQFLRIPYPILLAIGGAAIGLMPGTPEVELEPDLVLLILLPPILYAAAFFTPLRELRRNVKQISLLAVGLVLATMVGVAAVAHFALGFDWAPAFVLGAIVSPTDPVAATAIARQLGVPHRIITIVEGESL